MSLADPPTLIITGGDLPMDTASTPFDKSKEQWSLYNRVLRDEVPSNVKIHHTLGNHDIFGRRKTLSKATGNEPHYGKRWFLDNFEYKSTYRDFDAAGWKFIILDSIHLLPNGEDFVGRISGEQLDWLKQTLAATPKTTPVVIISHVPIMSVANYFDKDEEPWQTDWEDIKFPASRMHVDCRDLDALLRSHGNVKLALSGHLHLLDRCTYNGITYICDGAVSGAKWKGAKRETAEGYGLIDLFSDGTFEHTYQTYGWKAEPKAEHNSEPAVK
jgi:3',5'-cyclic AMP phosphodiesterase CpdA